MDYNKSPYKTIGGHLSPNESGDASLYKDCNNDSINDSDNQTIGDILCLIAKKQKK